MTGTTRLAEVELPDFGAPQERLELGAELYAARLERVRERMDARHYDRLVVYADRENSANLSYLAGFDPRFEEAVLVVGPSDEPAMLVGIPGDDRTTFTASIARRKGLTLQLCRRMRPADLDRAIAAAGSGTVSLAGLVTHGFPLADIAAAFRTLMARGGIKVVVRP